MRIKPEIKARIEKAFRDAGFGCKLNFDFRLDDLYTMGHAVPDKIIERCSISATVQVPKEWLEWD